MNGDHEDLLRQRFVDGELSEHEEQRFLGGLDDRPDGWRRLALAFAAQRIWAKACRASQEQRTSHDGQVSRSATMLARPWWCDRRQRRWAAAAVAVMVVALSVGFVAGSQSAIGRFHQPVAASDKRPPDVRPDRPSSGEPDAHPGPARPAMHVRFVRMGKEGPAAVDVPVFAARSLPVELLRGHDPLPPELRKKLVDSGYRIRVQRSLRTFALDDGRSIAMPVDTVSVSRPPYSAVQ